MSNGQSDALLPSYRTAFESMNQGFCLLEKVFTPPDAPSDFRFLLTNPAFEQQSSLHQVVGKTILEALPGTEPQVMAYYDQVALTGQPVHFQVYLSALDRWIDTHAFRLEGYDPPQIAVLFANITENKKAEEALRQSEQKYRTLFNSIDDAYAFCQILTDPAGQPVDYRFLEVNPAFENLTGIRIEKVLGQTARQVVPGLEDSWIETFGQVVLQGQTIRFENQVAPLDRWYDVYAGPSGEVGSGLFAMVFKDITERKRQQAHQTLLAEIIDDISELADPDQIMDLVGQKLMAVLPLTSFSIWQIHPQTNEVTQHFIWAKEPRPIPPQASMREFIDQQTIDLVKQGENLVITNTQADPRVQAGAFKALDIGSYVGISYRQIENRKTMLSVFSPIAYDWQPDQIALLTDVMNRLLPRIERAQAEAALKASEARLKAFFESLPLGVAEVDSNGKLVLANREMLRFLPRGIVPSHDPTLQDRWLAYHPDGRRLLPDEYPSARALRGERVVPGIEMLYTDDEGRPIWTRVVTVPIWNDEGQVTGIVAIVTDISQLKQAEEALRLADRRKDEFLAMLAHELRNPLASIRLGMELLSWTDETDPVQQQTVRLINQQVDHLVRLVDELLDVSRISRGKIQLKSQRLELAALIKDAVAAIRPQYDALGKGLHFTDWGNPLFVQGDATRLGQVVTNLLTNGLRYTGEQGQVWVSLEEKDGEALLRVADNGIGLTPDQQTAIFELFVQVDVSLARSQGGLGLGLTLVQQLVQLHGGRVQAHSPGLGQGSEFVIYLPLLEQFPKAPTLVASPIDAKVVHQRILVIDDNVGLAFLLAQTLKQSGYEVHTRHSGREGIQAADVLHPTVILCDIGMPELDGYETARLIRQQPWGQHMVMVAITGYGQEGDKERALKAGFDAHLVKPIDLPKLLGLLQASS